MKKTMLFLSSLLLHSSSFSIPAFPGAEGWGAESKGGRGGRVVVVTSLASTGPGTLHQALFMTTGPRIIVFRVSGQINLMPTSSSHWNYPLTGQRSYVTIAGQTSPGGITLTGSGSGTSILWCYTECGKTNKFHDGIFRHLRFRGQSHNLDAVTLEYSHNFIFDHCDFSGAGDETLDLCHDSTFTVQWCAITNSSVCGDCQTYGSLISYDPSCKMSICHNFFANHRDRGGVYVRWEDLGDTYAPFFGLIDYRNNVLYNIEELAFYFSFINQAEAHVNIVGNYTKAGPVTRPDMEKLYSWSGPSKFYDQDNCFFQANGAAYGCDRLSTRYATRMSQPWVMPSVSTTSSAQAYTDVQNKGGALPRDPMNLRTFNELKTGTGGLGKTDDPFITSGPNPPADTDLDGMPDFWETAMGFKANDSSDSRGDHDNDGYTNVEEYINDLALARACEDYYNPPYPIPNNWSDYDPSCAKSLTGVERDRSDGAFASLSAAPNPMTDGFIRFTALSGIGRLRIFDLSGRERVSIFGKVRITWNGRDRAGRLLPPGIYVARWQTPEGGRFERRITIL